MKGYILRDSNYDLERAKLATAESGRCWGVWGARRGARRQPGASGGCGGAPGARQQPCSQGTACPGPMECATARAACKANAGRGGDDVSGGVPDHDNAPLGGAGGNGEAAPVRTGKLCALCSVLLWT